MQLYEGLPIITNKITTEEQQGIPHHLLGRIGLHEQTWVVGRFVKRALGIIDEIRSRGKLPILVGGTHYYTQSLLFPDLLAEREDGGEEDGYVPDVEKEWPILQESTEVLLSELKKVDPVMANRWHPNDRRKIQRSLQIYLQSGRKASDVYVEQRQTSARQNDCGESQMEGVTVQTNTTRFPTLLFWVHADNDSLRPRLDRRVDNMLEHGLMDEVKALSAFADAESMAGRDVDFSRGIWVSIGYKEFKAYIEALGEGQLGEEQLELLRAEAIERTQIATRQYAKRQIRWIRIKLVNALAQAQSAKSLFLLDGSDIESYDANVLAPALELTESFLNASQPLPEPSFLSPTAADLLAPRRDYDLAAKPEKWIRKYCDLCGVTCVTEDQWMMHTKSKTHRKLSAKAKKAEAEQNGAADGHSAVP